MSKYFPITLLNKLPYTQPIHQPTQCPKNAHPPLPNALLYFVRSPRENVVSSSTQPNNRSGDSSSSTPNPTVGNGPVNSNYGAPVKKEASSTTANVRNKDPTSSVNVFLIFI